MDAALRKEFKRKCRETKVGKARESQLETVFAESEQLAELPLDFLGECLNFPLRWIQVNALYEIFRRSAERSDLPLHSDAVLSLAGNMSYDPATLTELLREVGFEVVPPGPATTHLILGPAPEGFPSELLTGPVLPFEALLPQLLTHPRFFLLQEGHAGEIQNIRQMILSGDFDSARLGLNLLLGGGLPEGFETEAFALWRSKRPHDLRMLARDLLLRFTTGRFKKNLLRKFLSFYTGDYQLIGLEQSIYDPEGAIDLGRYLRLNFQLSPLVASNAEVLVEYYHGFVDLPHSEALELLQLMDQNGRLRLPRAARVVPPAVYELRGLRSLELVNDQLERMPKGIAQMDSLLRFLVDGCLSELPEDLGQCRSLRWIWLRDMRLDGFPRVLLEVPHLRYLSWIRGLADPQRPLAIPEGLARMRLSSLHIEEESVEFSEPFFQHPTLQSLNISQSAFLPYRNRISELPQLQRLQLSLSEDEKADAQLRQGQLEGWRLEDKKENSLSFVRL